MVYIATCNLSLPSAHKLRKHVLPVGGTACWPAVQHLQPSLKRGMRHDTSYYEGVVQQRSAARFALFAAGPQ